MPIKLVYRLLILSVATLLSTGCGNNSDSIEQTSHRSAPIHRTDERTLEFSSSTAGSRQDIISPMISMQPIIPGMSWTYNITKGDRAVLFRRFSKDLLHGVEYMGLDNAGPMNEWSDIDSKLRYTVTSNTWQARTDMGPATFYKIQTETFKDGSWIHVNNGLSWGRIKLDLLSYAICETRDLNQATERMEPAFKMLIVDNVEHLFPTDRGTVFHTRFLTRDICLHRDAPDIVGEGEFSLSPLHLRAKDKWDFQTSDELVKITVPAGTFYTLCTTLTFSGPGEMDTVDRAYYAMKVGLVKWIQTTRGQINWSAELTEFNIPK